MECHSSGASEVSLGQRDFCCATKTYDFEAVSPKCCGFDKTEKKFDSREGENDWKLPSLPIPVAPLKDAFAQVEGLKKSEPNYPNSPPERAWGFKLLKQLSVFRL
jgi:hypothetical protein